MSEVYRDRGVAFRKKRDGLRSPSIETCEPKPENVMLELQHEAGQSSEIKIDIEEDSSSHGLETRLNGSLPLLINLINKLEQKEAAREAKKKIRESDLRFNYGETLGGMAQSLPGNTNTRILGCEEKPRPASQIANIPFNVRREIHRKAALFIHGANNGGVTPELESFAARHPLEVAVARQGNPIPKHKVKHY